MKDYFYLLFIFLISCSGNSQKINRKEISYIEKDRETGWSRGLNTKNKWGFIDKDSIVKIPFEYDFLNPFEYGLAYAKNKGKEFFINPENKIIIPPIYDKLDLFSEGLVSAKKNNKVGFLNTKGEVIIPFIYDSADSFWENKLCVVGKNGKFGVINLKGETVLDFIFESIKNPRKDNFLVAKKSGKYAFFETSGKQLSDYSFDEIICDENCNYLFTNGIAIVKKESKYELLNEKMATAFENSKFDSISVFDTFSNIVVKRNGKYGMYNAKLNKTVSLEFDFIEPYDTAHGNYSEYYNARKGKIYSIFNKDLKKIGESYEPIYNNFSTDNPGISFKNLKGKYGVVDWKGNEKIPFVYDEALDFKRSKNSIAKKNGKFGVVNYQNKEIFPFIYDKINELDEVENIENTYILSNKTEDKLLNINGEALLSVYRMIHPIFYDHSKFIIKKNNKFGIVDLQNKILLPIVFDEISDWVEYGPENRHIVKRNGKYGMVEYNTFKEKIPAIYDFVFITRNKVFVGKDKKYGIIDVNNTILCPLKFDEIKTNLGSGLGRFESKIYARNGKQYLEIDEKGKVLKEISQKLYEENTDRNFNQIPEPPKALKIK